ncbi:MAG TPA: CTP synthase [Caldisericia bacterium]|mgnify:CR=1 FL=1|nr:CTP synthase [Caldisericia bacterium]
MSAKFIFVIGGVMSSLGKGILSSSLGRVLIAKGYKVSILKFDPYLNVDAGLQNPYQHGEVFVTDDGAETDLDLGHYERFLDTNLTRLSNVTSGSVYSSVISMERKGDFLGATVQVIPHLTNEIKKRLLQLEEAEQPDIILGEVGGTVGDIEGLPFLEAIREFKNEHPDGDVIILHLTYLPHLKSTGELKTKPTQHSVAELRKVGIQPDIIACRSDVAINNEIKEKISLFCDVDKEMVFSVVDVGNIYDVPLLIENEGICKAILGLCRLEDRPSQLDEWERTVNIMNILTKSVDIAIVGKYTSMCDAYISLTEALKHAQIPNKVKVNIHWIAAEELENDQYQETLQKFDGILIPGGFGKRGVEGMILASKFAREKQVPFFGICLGMQIAVIDFARNCLRFTHANSTEFDPGTPYPVIDLMPEQKQTTQKGATMRLGLFTCKISQNTLAHQIYQKPEIHQRHRHRYEFNNMFKVRFESAQMIFSGIYQEKNLVEIIELKNHPFYFGCQFHPEYVSRPTRPEPVFTAFVEACLKYSETKHDAKID